MAAKATRNFMKIHHADAHTPFETMTITWGTQSERECAWQCNCSPVNAPPGSTPTSRCSYGRECNDYIWTAATKTCQLYSHPVPHTKAPFRYILTPPPSLLPTYSPTPLPATATRPSKEAGTEPLTAGQGLDSRASEQIAEDNQRAQEMGKQFAKMKKKLEAKISSATELNVQQKDLQNQMKMMQKEIDAVDSEENGADIRTTSDHLKKALADMKRKVAKKSGTHELVFAAQHFYYRQSDILGIASILVC